MTQPNADKLKGCPFVLKPSDDGKTAYLVDDRNGDTICEFRDYGPHFANNDKRFKAKQEIVMSAFTLYWGQQ